MSILSKSEVGVIKRIDEWILKNNDPSITYQYDEKSNVMDLNRKINQIDIRFVIKEIPPIPIRSITDAGTVTLFNLNLDADSIRLFPKPTLNRNWFILEVSNCNLSHNYFSFLSEASFQSCVFEQYFLSDPADLFPSGQRLHNCTIRDLVVKFQINQTIIPHWDKFISDNQIDSISYIFN